MKIENQELRNENDSLRKKVNDLGQRQINDLDQYHRRVKYTAFYQQQTQVHEILQQHTRPNHSWQ